MYLWAVAWRGQAVSAVRHSGAAPDPTAWAELSGAVMLAAVPVVGLLAAHALGSIAVPSRRDIRARWVAHLAFTSPSLLVAFGNYARILNARTLVTPLWMALWAACIAVVLMGGSAPAAPVNASER